jgi:hypothetical protein
MNIVTISAVNVEALTESRLVEATARYNETLLAVQEAFELKDKLELREYQRYVEACNMARHYAHESLIVSYRIYTRLTGEYIDGVLPDDRYGIADMADELLQAKVLKEDACLVPCDVP